MRTYSTTGITVSPAELPDDVMTFAQAMAGEKAVDLEADRLRILHECAAEIEKEAGRLFWDGAGDTARRTESEIDLTTLPVMLPACPVYPNTSGADVTLVSVESWDYDTATWETFAAEKYKRRPRGGVWIPRWAADASEYSPFLLRIIADILPADIAPYQAAEGLGRLFALRQNHRPGSKGGGVDQDGRIINLDNAMRRSGARDILGTLQLGWPA